MISKTTCPFCDDAKEELQKIGVAFRAYEVNKLGWDTKTLDQWHAVGKSRTFPKNFVGEVSIGGCSELISSIKSG